MRSRVALLVFGLCVGCRASMNADAQMKADFEGENSAEARADAAVEGEKAENETPAPDLDKTRALSGPMPSEEAIPLLGARHNVKVKSKEGAVACRCVSALLGPSSMSQLEWEGPMPRTKPETQLVFAFVPEAGECAGAPKNSRGASYWGYRVQGNDVIVLLEEWLPKPPQTVVAIIPKPPTGGQVYLAPVSRKLPYGKPLDDKSTRCALGNPGPQRSTTFDDAEIGTTRPAPELSDVAE